MDTATSNGASLAAIVKEQESLCKDGLRQTFGSTLCFGRMSRPIVSKVRLQRMRTMVGLWETARQLHSADQWPL